MVKPRLMPILITEGCPGSTVMAGASVGDRVCILKYTCPKGHEIHINKNNPLHEIYFNPQGPDHQFIWGGLDIIKTDQDDMEKEPVFVGHSIMFDKNAPFIVHSENRRFHKSFVLTYKEGLAVYFKPQDGFMVGAYSNIFIRASFRHI